MTGKGGKTRPTGIEPATFGSTVRCSNQLSYGPSIRLFHNSIRLFRNAHPADRRCPASCPARCLATAFQRPTDTDRAFRRPIATVRLSAARGAQVLPPQRCPSCPQCVADEGTVRRPCNLASFRPLSSRAMSKILLPPPSVGGSTIPPSRILSTAEQSVKSAPDVSP